MTTSFKVVDRRCPVVSITVSKHASPQSSTTTVMRAAIVDTGFSGAVALPASVISSLHLNVAGSENIVLADRTERACRTFHGYVSAEGIERRVVILELTGEPLLGMGFLRGLELCISGWPNGTVDIREPT